MFENTILINRNKNVKIKKNAEQVNCSGMSNGEMLSVSDKYDSVNECTQEISKLIKLHIRGVWQNVHKFFMKLAHRTSVCTL